jgi:type I restriction enzyme R subunit
VASIFGTITRNLVDALDPDQPASSLDEALAPLATNPELRNAILDVRKSYEQTIDETSRDTVLFAGYNPEARAKASVLVESFREYIEQHKDEIRALQVLYSRPHAERLTYGEIKELAQAISRPPRQWTPDILWRAYEVLDQSKVRGSGQRMLTDIVSLVRFTLHQDDELIPFRDTVEERFTAWLSAQRQRGVEFSVEQLQWLTWMKENIVGELAITNDSFEFTPFAEHGGIGKAVQVFGDQLAPLMEELTEALAA